MYRVYQIKKIRTSQGKKPSLRKASKSSIKANQTMTRKAPRSTTSMAGANIEIGATKMLIRDMLIGMQTWIDR